MDIIGISLWLAAGVFGALLALSSIALRTVQVEGRFPGIRPFFAIFVAACFAPFGFIGFAVGLVCIVTCAPFAVFGPWKA